MQPRKTEGHHKANRWALEGQRQPADEHNIVFVTAGTPHNIKNTGGKDLKLFAVYSPPAHAEGTVYKTGEEAMHEEEVA